MGYELMGRLHALAGRVARERRGQGTVEYVGLMLLVAVLIAGVVQAGRGLSEAGIAETVLEKLEGAIDGVGA